MTSTMVRDGADSAALSTGRGRTPPRVLALVWHRRRLALLLVCVVGAAMGAAVGALMPRGPDSAGPGLTVIVTALLLGGSAGVALRRRRAVIPALVAYVAALELVRLPIDGPTVDRIHLGSTFGVIAFATGRMFDGLLLVLPALIGVVYGAGLARWWSDDSTGHRRRTVVLRRMMAAGCVVALLGGAILVGQPARTEAIPGADGTPLAGSIAELGTVHVGGHDTTVMVRGNSAKAPVLLYLAGGPGGTDLGAMRLLGQPLEQDFVVATWDQRGAGTSYGALDPTSTLTLDQAVSDTIEVVEQLRARFDKDKVYLVGNSWGTILAVLAVQQRPDLFAAFVGAGQMVSTTVTDQMFYGDALAWARRTGDDGLVQTLIEYGPPPYEDLLKYGTVASLEHQWNGYAMAPGYAQKGELPFDLNVPEYDLVQKVRGFASFLDTYSVLYPQLQDLDLRAQASRLQVPVYVVEGESEARGRVIPAREWFESLDAPAKQWIQLPQSGHRPHFEQPDRFADVMRTVLTETR